MRIVVMGAGPAGLYASQLWKARHPADEVEVFEQNQAGATFGFGVVFSDKALDFLRADDPATVELITPRMERWRDITLAHRGERIVIDGIGFSGIGRLELLRLLEGRARDVGVGFNYGRAITSLGELGPADLIIGADGINSLVRRSFEAEFGTSLGYLDNKFAWFGTAEPFDTLTQTFVDTPAGPFNAHHYRYAPGASTFIVECGRETWLRAGLDRMDEAGSMAFTEQVFRDALGGRPLVANRSLWRSFPTLWTTRWAWRNMALVGDAAHTAHFSIGSGTRLALEDVIALVKALEAHPGDIPAGLAAYDTTRRPVARKIVEAALTSARWYEDFGHHMRLPPMEFALSYIMRSGRIDMDRLAEISPRFVAAYRTRSDAGRAA